MASPEYLALRAYHYSRMLAGRLSGRRDRWRGVRILGYHRLSDEREPLSVAPAVFRRQMEAVRAAGLIPVSLQRAVELLGSAELDQRYLCVTFDDGYVDNVEHGEPVLAELEIPATIFLPTGVIDRRTTYFWMERPAPALSWDEVRAAAARGVISFESHTDGHPWLTQLTDAQARHEFTASRAAIERETGRPATSIAFPGGLYGARERNLVIEAGYRAGLTTDHGVNAAGVDLTALKRTLIYSGDGPRDFAAKLSGLLDGPARLRTLLYRRLGPTRTTPDVIAERRT